MSEVVTVHESKPGWLKSINWAFAIPAVLAIFQAAGGQIGSVSQYIPKEYLPGTILTGAAIVLVKLATWIYYKAVNKARKIKIEDNGNAKEITG